MIYFNQGERIMSEYKNGKILLSMDAMKAFLGKANNPTDAIIDGRNDFFNGIKIVYTKDSVVGIIKDFDDSFIK